ncbi:hypothetical protein [Aeromonas enteropelogenes]|uniref:hypothetical protein n=1 Tax=Aeromonas enteropelogenes TaxID=29489 RepID=UPI003BA3D04E
MWLKSRLARFGIDYPKSGSIQIQKIELAHREKRALKMGACIQDEAVNRDPERMSCIGIIGILFVIRQIV